jgi:hypothetical protein
MRYDSDLRTIERILAELYSDVSEAKRLIDYVGLSAERISWEGKAIEIWHGILTEACISKKVHELVKECIRDRNYEELENAYGEYVIAKESAVPPDVNINKMDLPLKIDETGDNAYAEYIECKITFCEDISLAKHEYRYRLRNFGYNEGEDKFHFIITNAEPNQVTKITAFDGETEIVVDKESFKQSTKLILSRLLPLKDGNTKTLCFSYDAPTSRLIHQGHFISVGYYQAELFHEFEITKNERVIIKFPKGTRIQTPIHVSAKVEGTTVMFDAYNIPKLEMRTFPIFFTTTRKMKILLTTLTGIVLLSALIVMIVYWFRRV